MNILNDQKLILASKSPRRKELLEKADIKFKIEIREVEELYPKTLDIKKVPAFLAKLKASAFEGKMKENEILLTADTIVIHNDKVLGKPKDKAQAVDYLKKLSNDVHTVITAVLLSSNSKNVLIEDKSEVVLYALTNEEINWYLDKYKPFDKAGSYGIQDWIGYAKIKAIKGSYATIMGLPIARVYKELKEWND